MGIDRLSELSQSGFCCSILCNSCATNMLLANTQHPRWNLTLPMCWNARPLLPLPQRCHRTFELNVPDKPVGVDIVGSRITLRSLAKLDIA
jgi:hypothetical protein